MKSARPIAKTSIGVTSISVFAGVLLQTAGAFGQPADGDKIAAAKALFQSLSEQDQQLLLKELKKPSRQKQAKGQTAVPASTRLNTPATGTPAPEPSKRVAILSKRSDSQSNPYKDCTGFIPLLRQNWKDIDIANCPEAVAKATGATISYTGDRVKNNNSWAVDGTAALIYNAKGEEFATSTGAYVTVNRLSNSAKSQADNNADTLAYGGYFEYGTAFSDWPYYGGYLRVRGGGVDDRIRGTNSGQATLEVIPVVADGNFRVHTPFEPIPGLVLRVDPELIVQYDRIVGGGKTLAFNNLSEALRVGPQVTLKVFPGTSEFLSHFVGSVTYHWGYETYSQRGLDWFQTALTYNFDPEGYIGLTGGYKRGHDENTGVFTNIYTISLTGKI
jgi:hypothetical protein